MQRKTKFTYKKTDSIVEKLCSIRGIRDLNNWINPSSKYVHSPYELDNIDEAVQRIVKAIHMKEKIVIFADVDFDGVSSTGIMFNYLKPLTDNVSYIHSQRSSGHGLETIIKELDSSIDLLIIVDSSSNSIEPCRVAKEELGIDIVCIDHHEIEVENPYMTLVNCQAGDYPNKSLSGSGMVYKVCQVLDEYLDLDMSDDFLDLASMGIIADMMSVFNMENRYLIYNGLNKIENLGIQEVLRQSKVPYEDGITTTNVSFKVAPIVSACSRFDKIEMALELVTSDDEDRIKELAKEMIKLNERRKAEQKEIVENVIVDIDTSDNIIMIINNDIDSGFRGLVATEVVERYSKPVFVLSKFSKPNGNIVYAGSARSVGLIPLREMCQESGLFKFATGHSQAHGVEFDESNMPLIKEYFNKKLKADDLQKVVEYDLELNVVDIDEIDIKQVEKFSKITGQGFPEPTFKINGILVEEGYSKKLGKHCRTVLGANADTIKINCENNFALMKFRSSSSYGEDIEKHFRDNANFITELEVVGSLNLNVFYNWGTRKNEITKQIFINDYKIVE